MEVSSRNSNQRLGGQGRVGFKFLGDQLQTPRIAEATERAVEIVMIIPMIRFSSSMKMDPTDKTTTAMAINMSR